MINLPPLGFCARHLLVHAHPINRRFKLFRTHYISGRQRFNNIPNFSIIFVDALFSICSMSNVFNLFFSLSYFTIILLHNVHLDCCGQRYPGISLANLLIYVFPTLFVHHTPFLMSENLPPTNDIFKQSIILHTHCVMLTVALLWMDARICIWNAPTTRTLRSEEKWAGGI